MSRKAVKAVKEEVVQEINSRIPRSDSLEYEVKIQSLKTEGALRANATVNINESFAIRGVKILEGSKGLFVSMPSYKAGNGEYKDICFPCTAEARKEFDKVVIGAYEQAVLKMQATSGQEEVVKEAHELKTESQGHSLTM